MPTNPQLSDTTWKIALGLRQLVVSELSFLLSNSKLKGYSTQRRHQIRQGNLSQKSTWDTGMTEVPWLEITISLVGQRAGEAPAPQQVFTISQLWVQYVETVFFPPF